MSELNEFRMLLGLCFVGYTILLIGVGYLQSYKKKGYKSRKLGKMLLFSKIER